MRLDLSIQKNGMEFYLIQKKYSQFRVKIVLYLVINVKIKKKNYGASKQD